MGVNLTYMNKEHIIELKEIAMENFDKLVIHPYSQDDLGLHRHQFFELVYITGGTTVHGLNGHNTVLNKGDYFIIDYNSRHCYEESNNLTIINCLFLPEVIEDTLKGCYSFEMLMQRCLLRYYKFYSGQTLSNRIFHDEDGEILKLLTGIQKEYYEKQVGYIDVFRLRLKEIFIITVRKIIGSNALSMNNLVMEVIRYINNNYQNKKILSRFCDEYHFSLQYVSRKFKQETGITIMNYLQRVRIEKSCELLTGSDKPITEIALEAGYEDVKFFNKMFKCMLQMTPREYRKMSVL